MEIIAHSSEERLDGKWFRKIGFASALPDFFGDHRNMTQMFASLRDLKSGRTLTRPFSKKEGYDHRIPTAMERISWYGTINPTDMSKTKSTKFTVSVKAATKKFELVSDKYQRKLEQLDAGHPIESV